MGLYSYVKLELPCPYCGFTIKDYQSKDGILMELNEPWTLENFYSSCPKCKKWVEYIRKGNPKSNIDLIGEGMEAINLLRHYINLDTELDYVNYIEEIEKFLKKTNYPTDTSDWMQWYGLKEYF